MIFNIKSRNRDDHSKNFSFLLDEKHEWHLTPAYDLTPSHGINDEQTCMVNGKGKNITDEDMIATAQSVQVTASEICSIIERVSDAVQKYKILNL